MTARIATPWSTADGANVPRITLDHPLPAGASCIDVTAQEWWQIPTNPNAYVVELWRVTSDWLASVEADTTYIVLWSEANEDED